MVTVEGYEIPNLVSELTVEQFDKLNNIENNKDLDIVEKWLYKFVYLGIPEEVFDDMELTKMKEYVDLWDVPPVVGDKQLTIEIDGYTYEAKESIGVKDLSLIEKAWKKNVSNFSSESLAVLFKRTDLSRTEHYAPAHIKQKLKLFSQQKAELALPYVVDIIKTLTNTAEDANSESLESNNG